MRRRVERPQPHFNEDVHLASAVARMRELGVVHAVETGTYRGETTRYLASIFESVYTIEANPKYYRNAKARLRRVPNVTMLHGDSGVLLETILAGLTKRVFIFLDAHWYEHCPIKDEIKTIAAHRHLDPVLAIHDFKNPHHPEFGFDPVNGKELSWDYLGDLIKSIHGDESEIFYNDIAVGAKRGVIFAGRRLERVRAEYGTALVSF